MRPQIVILAGLIVFILVTCILVYGEGVPSTEPSNPIPLSELHERGVAGRLGPRMGTIVEVTGTVVENESKMKADVSEPFFLRVEEVNGQTLQTPELFSSSAMKLIRRVPSLKIGDHFKCVGYERGEFKGSPDGEFEYVLPYTTQGFFFDVDFVVLKVN